VPNTTSVAVSERNYLEPFQFSFLSRLQVQSDSFGAMAHLSLQSRKALRSGHCPSQKAGLNNKKIPK
jgi:hypothetical protein